jgi:hypothetical protein
VLVGILAQSGGMFVHAFRGRSGEWSAGNTLTVGGGAVLAAGLLILAYGVATT